MNITEILKSYGVESEKIDSISDAINKEIPKEFVSKKQYAKKVDYIDELNNTIADMEANQKKVDTDEYKNKYNDLVKDFELYKNNIETEKNNTVKTSLLKEALKTDGVTNDKLANLLLKEFDLNKIEIEDNKIKGYEELSKGLKENYSDFFSTTKTIGNNPATPPTDGNAKQFTLESLKGMSKEEIKKKIF